MKAFHRLCPFVMLVASAGWLAVFLRYPELLSDNQKCLIHGAEPVATPCDIRIISPPCWNVEFRCNIPPCDGTACLGCSRLDWYGYKESTGRPFNALTSNYDIDPNGCGTLWSVIPLCNQVIEDGQAICKCTGGVPGSTPCAALKLVRRSPCAEQP